jgi:hypothetical protein
MKPVPYNYMSFRHRLQASAKLLARARKQGVGHMCRVMLTEQPALYLGPTRQLDGLSLYRQAVSKLRVPPVIWDDRGRTIMLISHCH